MTEWMKCVSRRRARWVMLVGPDSESDVEVEEEEVDDEEEPGEDGEHVDVHLGQGSLLFVL